MGRRRQGQGDRPAGQPGRRRREVQRRQQRRPHDRHRRGRGAAEVRAAPAALGHPHAGLRAGDRQRGRHRPRRAVRGDRRAGGPRRRHVRAGRQQLRAPHHAVQPHHRPGHRALPRQVQDRHHRPRHRPDLRRQDGAHRHPGAGPVRRGRATGEGCRRAEPEEPDARQDLQPQGLRRRRRRRRTRVLRRAAATDGRRHLAAARADARRRPHGGARGRPGDAARRRPRHLPVRDELERDGRRRVHRQRHPADADQPGDRDREGLHDAGRRGAVPDRVARRRRASCCARRARSSARPPAGRAAAAGSTR